MSEFLDIISSLHQVATLTVNLFFAAGIGSRFPLTSPDSRSTTLKRFEGSTAVNEIIGVEILGVDGPSFDGGVVSPELEKFLNGTTYALY